MTPQGGFAVRYTDGARDDLLRLFDFLLERAQTAEDFDLAQRAIDAVVDAVERQLGRTPFIFRKAASSPFLRELIIPFGHAGYVVLYEVRDATTVDILAVRHQREDDYH
jgi:plasmid stabilization system protein ParE